MRWVMFWKDLITALIISLGLSAIFIAGFRKKGPWDNFLVFFAIIFLTSWAGGIWISPLGPPIGGVYWLPFLIIGLTFALLLAAVTSPFPRDTTVRLVEAGEKTPEKRKAMVLGVYFWLLIFALVIMIVTRYS
jgi:hypothetical protein